MNNQGADVLRLPCENARGVGIDSACVGFVGFRCVNGRVRGCVDHQLRLDSAHDLANGFRLAQVQLGSVWRNHIAKLGKQPTQFGTDLSGFAHQQDCWFHSSEYRGRNLSWTSASLGLFASLFERAGADVPQWMAKAGSFQRMPYSSDGHSNH